MSGPIPGWPETFPSYDEDDVTTSLRAALREETAINQVLRAQFADVAAFLDKLADRMDKLADRMEQHMVGVDSEAADCRAMAAKLRGKP